jgi:hypothetical protein
MRPIAPLSTARVSARRPRVRWVNGLAHFGAQVDFCADRACTQLIETVMSTGNTASPSMDFPPGTVHWRIRSVEGASVMGPTWQLRVGVGNGLAAEHSGTILDLNGDGFGELAVGADGMSSSRGEVYVFHGSAAGAPGNPTLEFSPSETSAVGFGMSVASLGGRGGARERGIHARDVCSLAAWTAARARSRGDAARCSLRCGVVCAGNTHCINGLCGCADSCHECSPGRCEPPGSVCT